MNKNLILLIIAAFTAFYSSAQTKAEKISTISNSTSTEKTFSVASDDWKRVGKSGEAGCYVSYIYKTDDVTKNLSKGATIVVYVKSTSGSDWFKLPHSYTASGMEITTEAICKEGTIELRTHTTKNVLLSPQNKLEYKVVITTD